MLLLLALTASEALVAGPGALHSHSGLSVAARSSPAVAQFGLFNKGDASASTKAKKGKQVKKAVKKSFLPFQKAPEPEPEPESPLEALKSLSGVAFLLSVPGAAATVVALIILVGNGKPPDSTPFEFLNGFYPPAVEKKKAVKAKNDAIEKQNAKTLHHNEFGYWGLPPEDGGSWPPPRPKKKKSEGEFRSRFSR